ncbi:MAG: mechanosensitive ion channel, partial [Chloroflexi bacterium]|nr:mechanosensitive ion channel [Chloroflexota bacterium]
MLQQLGAFLSTDPYRQIAWILGAFLVAYIIQRLARPLGWRLARLSQFAPTDRRSSPQRLATLTGLMRGLITFLVYVFAILVSLSQFVDADTLLWVVGLFSAGFGFGARPLVSDYLAGLSFLFEDSFDVGEKVEFDIPAVQEISGIIEDVNLRTTHLRANNGELFTIPNGEIRVVRNFSRGEFSTANVNLSVPAADVSRALPILEELGQAAVEQFEEIIEPWKVISASTYLGSTVELKLLVKTRHGAAAFLRPRLITLIYDRLQAEQIHPAGSNGEPAIQS